MFGQGIHLFYLFGFDIRLDLSWFFIAILLTWSLAAGLFPMMIPELSATEYWLMGLVGMLALFFSIVLHEIGHSVIARRYNLGITSITLFIFGGVADLKEEPKSPGAEFFIAIGGPIVSILIAITFFATTVLGLFMGWPLQILTITEYLWFINVILVIFNMIPAFPLDGGRVLRAALWKFKGNVRSATRISSAIGSTFGILLILLGVFGFVTGNVIGGVWWILIGFFVRAAASMSYKQMLLREELQGEPVGRFIKENSARVAPDLSIEELVDKYLYSDSQSIYPVVENRQLIGYVSLEEVRNYPQDEWQRRTMTDIYIPASPENTISVNSDAMQALIKMSKTGQPELMVNNNGVFAGIVSRRDLIRYFSVRSELKSDVEGDRAP